MSDKSSTPRLLIRAAVAIAVLAAIAFGVVQYVRPTARVETVISGMAVDAKQGSITVQEEYAEQIKSEIGGRVLDKGYKLDTGLKVKKGDVLVQLDTGDIDIEIQQAKNELESSKQKMAVGSAATFELQSAQSDFVNTERLYKMGQLSQSDYEKARRLIETANQKLALEKVVDEENLGLDKTTLATKERSKEKMTIVAPFDGEVSAVLAHPGDLIDKGSPIVSLITRTRVVEAKISEEDFANIRVGQKATAIFLPYGEWEYNGTVTKILPTADPETQRHLVDLEITDIAPEKLIPGYTGEVSIVVGSRDAKAIIPRRALLNESVYVVKDGKVELRHVKSGYLWVTGAEIVEGLEPGEQVIVEDAEKYRDGDSVKVLELPSDAFGRKK
jgi:RND family efflux transporter MFP subunit